MKDGERERPIENYGKKERKEWLDNTLPDPHPCTAGNKEKEHVFCFLLVLFPYVPVRAIETLNPNHSCSDLIEMLNDTITFFIIKLQFFFNATTF